MSLFASSDWPLAVTGMRALFLVGRESPAVRVFGRDGL